MKRQLTQIICATWRALIHAVLKLSRAGFDTRKPLMAANWLQLSRDWARAALSDSNFADALRARKTEFLTASLTDGGLDKLQSSSKNGVSFTVQTGGNMSLSKSEELAALTRAVEWLDAGVVPSQTRSMGRF